MKPFSFEPLRQWFGFSRRERRSSFFLLVLITIVTGVRFIVPSRHETIEAVAIQLPGRITDTITGRLPEKPAASDIKRPSRQVSAKVLELNTCDSAALEALPGIGPVLAARIIKYRNLLGGYFSAEQLREVYGLSQETYEMVRERVRADAGLVKKININSAGYKELIRLRYLEKSDIQSILKYRELKGRIESTDELVKNKILTEDKAGKAKWYVEY